MKKSVIYDLDAEQVGQMIGVTGETVRRWCNTKPKPKIPHCKLSQKIVRFNAEEIEEWILSRRRAA